MTASIIIAAIDPGLTGAVAFLDPSDHPSASVHDMPRIADGVEPLELQQLVLSHRASVGIIEKVTPMPSQQGEPGGKRRSMGAKSAFGFGGAYHAARTVLVLCDMPLHTIVPGTWKKAMGLSGGEGAKERARQRAIELFPRLQPSLRRKSDHNRAEALLLALYCANHILSWRAVA